MLFGALPEKLKFTTLNIFLPALNTAWQEPGAYSVRIAQDAGEVDIERRSSRSMTELAWLLAGAGKSVPRHRYARFDHRRDGFLICWSAEERTNSQKIHL